MLIVYGLWQCSTAEYIALTGVDMFGLAPHYGIDLPDVRAGVAAALRPLPPGLAVP